MKNIFSCTVYVQKGVGFLIDEYHTRMNENQEVLKKIHTNGHVNCNSDRCVDEPSISDF